MTYTATYSPEDNKLRLYASWRLDAETYARVKAAGFKWAPKQELFVAPMWTPSREDLLIQLAGEIDDEDKSLVDRAEERAERFEDYSEARQEDADRAHAAVHAIADNIPFGQPILVGHHSEKHARRDAEKIDNGMRRAVKMWEQSKYWEQRAAGALRHAKYKERPDVRGRRIKGLEADKRRQERYLATYTQSLEVWRKVAATEDAEQRDKLAEFVSGRDSAHLSYKFPLSEYPRTEHTYEGDMSLYSAIIDHIIDGAKAAELAIRTLERCTRDGSSYHRWIAHYNNRIAYERAMLAEDGGLVAEQEEIKIGGRVLVRGEWVTVLRINRKDGKVCSFTTNRRYCRVIGVEEVKGYEPPSEEQAADVAQAIKRPPLCNYPGERFATCTEAEWKAIHKDYKSTVHVIEATETTARHCVRYAIGFKLHLPEPTPKEIEFEAQRSTRAHIYWPVYITDAKRKDPPAKDTVPAPVHIPRPTPDLAALTERAERATAQRQPDPTAAKFEALRETVKAGVHVVSAPQLFPTPPDLARRMADEAGILAGRRVLEPSAGTGNLIRAAMDNATGFDCFSLVAVEQNYNLVQQLERQRNVTVYANSQNFRIVQADFLGCNPDHVGLETLGYFDVILMNPPFANGDDIKHIKHAITFLKPGGRLVAICANGPRQNEQLRPMIEEAGGTWEPLPAGTFEESGTGVNTALIVYDAPEDDRAEYCEQCKPIEHDSCSLTAGCPCCDETKKQMTEDAYKYQSQDSLF